MSSRPLNEDEIDGLEEITDIEIRGPHSMVLSLRLNREEFTLLSDAARFYDEKLSTWIKQQAIARAREPFMQLTVTAERSTS